MTKFLEDGRVVGQRSLSHDIRIMEIWSPQVAASAEPGQFVTVKSNDLSVPLLRRPLGYPASIVTKVPSFSSTGLWGGDAAA